MSDDDKRPERAWREVLKSITVVAGTLTALFAALSTALLLMANSLQNAPLVCGAVGILCPVAVAHPQTKPNGKPTVPATRPQHHPTAVPQKISVVRRPPARSNDTGFLAPLIWAVAAATILSALGWVVALVWRSIGIAGLWNGYASTEGGIQQEYLILRQFFGAVWGQQVVKITGADREIVVRSRIWGRYRDGLFTGIYWSENQEEHSRGVITMKLLPSKSGFEGFIIPYEIDGGRMELHAIKYEWRKTPPA